MDMLKGKTFIFLIWKLGNNADEEESDRSIKCALHNVVAELSPSICMYLPLVKP